MRQLSPLNIQAASCYTHCVRRPLLQMIKVCVKAGNASIVSLEHTSCFMLHTHCVHHHVRIIICKVCTSLDKNLFRTSSVSYFRCCCNLKNQWKWTSSRVSTTEIANINVSPEPGITSTISENSLLKSQNSSVLDLVDEWNYKFKLDHVETWQTNTTCLLAFLMTLSDLDLWKRTAWWTLCKVWNISLK